MTGNSESTATGNSLRNSLSLIHPVIEHLCSRNRGSAQEESDKQSNTAELQAIGEAGFERQAGWIQDAEAFALLQQLHAGRHRRIILLLQQIVIRGLRLIVAARQVGQLLLANRLFIQPGLIFVDLRRDRRDRLLAVLDLDLVGLSAGFAAELIDGGSLGLRCRLVQPPSGCRIVGFRLLVRQELVPLRLGLRDLILHAANLRILISDRSS